MVKTGVAVRVFGFLLTCVACQTSDLEKEEAVRNLIAGYAESANEVDDLWILVAWDAVLMPEGGPARVGKQAIRSFFEERSSRAAIRLRMNPVDVIVRDDWAIAHTEDAWRETPKGGGASESFHTVSLLVLRQDDYGEWRIAGHMWSLDEGAL
jgi:ketosteroid isomerase-like protein